MMFVEQMYCNNYSISNLPHFYTALYCRCL